MLVERVLRAFEQEKQEQKAELGSPQPVSQGPAGVVTTVQECSRHRRPGVPCVSLGPLPGCMGLLHPLTPQGQVGRGRPCGC